MEEQGSKKKYLLPLLVLTGLILVVGGSYALWQITLQQTDTNIITTGCFKVDFKDANPINLQEALPITDDEGKLLLPYEVTLTNTCASYATYQVNMEVLDTTTFNRHEFIKVNFEDRTPIVLTSKTETTTTIANATKAYRIESGFLNPNEEKILKLRLWISDDAPVSEEIMNKLFESKVTIITSYHNEAPTYEERVNTCKEDGYTEEFCTTDNAEYQ